MKKEIDKILKGLYMYKPFVYKKNKNSCYIHFKALPKGITHKLRVSDHNERFRYGYKWQLRLDTDSIQYKKHSKYFRKVNSLIKAFKSYYNVVKYKK